MKLIPLLLLLILTLQCHQDESKKIHPLYQSFSPALQQHYMSALELTKLANRYLQTADSLYQTITELQQIACTLNNPTVLEKTLKQCDSLENQANTLYISALQKHSSANHAKFEVFTYLLDSLTKTKKIATVQKLIAEAKERYSNIEQSLRQYSQEELMDIERKSVMYAYENKAIQTLLVALSTFQNWSESEKKEVFAQHQTCVKFGVFFADSPQLLSVVELKDKYESKENLYMNIRKGHYFYYLGSTESFEKADSILRNCGAENGEIRVNRGVVQIYHHLNEAFSINPNYFYRLQVFASPKRLEKEKIAEFPIKNYRLSIDSLKGLYKYYIGDFQSYNEALKFKSENQLHKSFILKIPKPKQ